MVDDNKVNRLMLSRMLELLGHDVSSADNGRTALDKLRTERFDLLLLDLKMPEMDGFDLLERRAIEPSMQNVPVIVTSSLEGVTHVARCIELGADDFLHKPVNPVLLKARVDSSLERKFLRDRQRANLARLGPGMRDGPEVNAAARCEEATLLVARAVGLSGAFGAEACRRNAGVAQQLDHTDDRRHRRPRRPGAGDDGRQPPRHLRFVASLGRRSCFGMVGHRGRQRNVRTGPPVQRGAHCRREVRLSAWVSVWRAEKWWRAMPARRGDRCS